MFKAKILVLGPCEVFCIHSATNVSILCCEGTFQSYVVFFFKERIRVSSELMIRLVGCMDKVR